MGTGDGRVAHAISTPLPGGYAGGAITHAPAWGGLVAWDLLFNGISTGLFLVAAICEIAAPRVFASVAGVAYAVALGLLVVDLAALVFDLGDPLRFHHMLRVIKPGSPMSVGTWCLTLYSLPLTVAAAISVLPGDWTRLETVRHVAIVAGLLPALGSPASRGALLGRTAPPGGTAGTW